MKLIFTLAISLSLYGQTASLLPPVKAQFLNANGTPMVGGKVCTYIAGTTTPQQTFTDSTLTVPNSNPIILDSRGEANIWLSSTNPYKIVLRQPGGVNSPFVTACSDTSQVYSVDNVSSASGGGGGGGSTLPVDDTTAIVRNVTDNSKQVRISAASLSPFATRILSMPDTNLTIAGRDVPNTFTQTQTFGANIVPSSAGSWNVGTNSLPFSTSVFAEYYARTATGLCNYASIAANNVTGGTIAAQNAACAVQAQMGANGFDTVGTAGSYRVQGTEVIDPSRILRSIGGVGTELIPTVNETYDLGSASLRYRQSYTRNAYVNALEPLSSGTGTVGLFGFGEFDGFRIYTSLRFKGSTTAGWIMTALDANGNVDWAAPPTGTLPSQTGNAGKYLTTDGTNASWGTVSGSGISSLGGQTGATQTFANDTNVTISSAGNTHTLGWTGQLAAARGGTGLSAFTRTGNTTQFATWTGATTASRCVETDASGNLTVAAAACGTGGGGITSLNSQTGSSQTFAVGSIGTDFAISSSSNVHTFNLPNAGTTARGLISTTSQTLGGEKTFNDGARSGNFLPVTTGTGNVGTNSNRFVSGHVISMTHQSDGSTLGAVRVRNSATSKVGSIADNGTDIELSINNGSTNFLVNGSSLVFGLTATTMNLVPDATFSRDLGSTSSRYNNLYVRNILAYAQNSSNAANLSLRNSSSQLRALFSADDTLGGEFSLFDSGGSNFFSAVNGNVRYNGNAGQTTTVTVGACTMTFNQGGLTAKSGC